MRKIIFAFAATAILALSPARARQESTFDPSRLSESGGRAYQRLLSAGMFTIGPIGYAASTSEEELALHTLLKERDARDALKDLINRASPEGSLYGLFGLRSIDAELFRKEVERYKARPELPERTLPVPHRNREIPAGHIITMRGCFILREKIQKVVKAIEAGDYDENFRRSGGKN